MTTWEIDGAEALATHAPEASAAYARVVEVRPIGVRDELLEDPAVARLIGTSATAVDDEMRARLVAAAGDDLAAVVQMLWIADATARLRAGLDAVFAPSTWQAPRRYPVADIAAVVEDFRQAIAGLDSTLTPAGLGEAVRAAPGAIDASVVESVRRELTPAQAVEVVLHVARDAADQVVAALDTGTLTSI